MNNIKEDKMIGTAQSAIPGQSFNVDMPTNLPVVYTDMIHMTINEFGVVFDFGQRMGPTNKVNIVSRVGMSKEHADALRNLLDTELKKKRV